MGAGPGDRDAPIEISARKRPPSIRIDGGLTNGGVPYGA